MFYKSLRFLCVSAFVFPGLSVAVSADEPKAADEKPVPIGYTDTPLIPGQKWRVHDATRPEPYGVIAGTESNQCRAGRAPSDAIVLFDGSGLSKWVGNDGKEAKWKVENGYMEVVAKTGSIKTKQGFGSCQLHVEFATPAKVEGDSQHRGNSGVFLMDSYEIQVLDSFQNRSYSDGQAAAIYGQYPPLVNASRAPGKWQTYDIIFEAPKFDGEKVVTPAYVTIIHNGVLVHHHAKILGHVVHADAPTYQPHPEKAPISLQDHGNPMRFRNIWIRPLRGYDERVGDKSSGATNG